MKNLLVLSLFFFLQNFSFASSTSLPTNSGLVLQVKTEGGYVSRDYIGHEEGLSIYTNGRVVAFSKKNSLSPLKLVLLAQLSQHVLKNIINYKEAIKKSELISERPDDPMCADLPETNYSLRKKDGTYFPFARFADCHNYYVKGKEAKLLKSMMDGLRILVPENMN